MNGNLWILLAIFFPCTAALLLLLARFPSRGILRAFFLLAVGCSSLCAFLAALYAPAGQPLLFGSGALTLCLQADALSRGFTCLLVGLWLLVSCYACCYMAHEGRERSFYLFFLLTLAAMLGVGYAGNLFTLYLFYELMTLATFPLVMHNQSTAAVAAGRKYLIYSFSGAALALFGIFFFISYATGTSFSPGGILDPARIAGKEQLLRGVYLLTVIGFGAKAGLFPLHAWLTTAHPIAPSPASAVLSGLITKAGVLAILRTSYQVVGPELLRDSWVQSLLLALVLLTILMGSLLALREPLLKRRLAYSSISQVSYILFGALLFFPQALRGALLHLLCHALMKNLLFLAAGAIIMVSGKTLVDELRGLGRQMPWTMLCFASGALALIGIPPFIGFYSKYHLALGALNSGLPCYQYLGPVVLILSALLSAGYLLPILSQGFFPGAEASIPARHEAPAAMRWPMLLLALACAGGYLIAGPLIESWLSAATATLFA